MRSFLIDIVVPCILCSTVVIPTAIISNDYAHLNQDGAFALAMSVLIASILVLVAFSVWNSGYRQGTTGQSIGRRITKTKLVKIETGEPIGFGMALLRLIFLAVTLSIYGIGFLSCLWPLWDPKRQTVTDKIFKAVVVRIDDTTR